MNIKRELVSEKWGCGLVIINKDGEVLMGRRCKSDDLDQWSFAGGSVEIGETPKEAVMREALEEMSLTVKRLEYVDSFELDGIKDFIFMTTKEACYGIPSPYVKEFSELKWINFKDFCELEIKGKIYPASSKAIARLRERV